MIHIYILQYIFYIWATGPAGLSCVTKLFISYGQFAVKRDECDRCACSALSTTGVAYA